MSASVLGKRNRASITIAEEGSPRVTRSTRRTKFVIENNENENPFVTRRTAQSTLHIEEVEDVDELALDAEPAAKKAKSNTVPAKHGAAESRVVLSPTKISGHFKASKPTAGGSVRSGKPSTPQTPRHRDALSKKAPVTPRHRVTVPGKPLTPRTPRTPFTPHTSVPTVYNEARQLFSRTVTSGRLVGRDAERTEVQCFVAARVDNASSGCIYISGPPGTGKSAMVNEVSTEFEGNESIRMAYINCMSIKTARDICAKLLEELGELEEVMEGSEWECLKRIFSDDQLTYLVTLDEIDHLLEIDIELLYNLFECSLDPSSNLILIGIANALDFTDRFLPRLKARGLKPHLLPFLPYTASEIANVITTKLRSLLPVSTSVPDFVPFLHPAAIQFISKKVSSQTGDLRKAFEIARRTIDLVEADTRDKHLKSTEQTPPPSPSPSKTPLVENMNLSSPPTPRRTAPTATTTPTRKPGAAPPSALAHLTIATAPRATIAHAARITAAVFGQGSASRLRALNLQQKAVLCALAALEAAARRQTTLTAHFARAASSSTTPGKKQGGSHTGSGASAPSIKALYAAYAAACRRDNALHPLTPTEFRDVVGSLETLSLVAAVDGKGEGGAGAAAMGTPSRRGRGRPPSGFGSARGTGEERRVASRVGEKELRGALEGVGSGILKGILEGEA